LTAWIITADVLDGLARLPDESVHCVVTSPPYWGLRNYEVAGQMGCEPTLGEHIAAIVDMFREVRRVLRRDGTVWLNYGDCYATAPNGRRAAEVKALGADDRTFRDKPFSTVGPVYDPGGGQKGGGWRGANKANSHSPGGRIVAGGVLKPKDLVMMANRVAIALQDDGWWVRSEIVWDKKNPMPESIRDRPGTAHEKVWLLAKSGRPTIWRARDTREWSHAPDWAERVPWPCDADPGRTRNRWMGFDYYYDQDAVKVPVSPNTHARLAQGYKMPDGWDTGVDAHGSFHRAGREKGRPAAKQDGHGRRHAGFNDRYFRTGESSRMNADRVPEPRKTPKSVEPGRGIKANRSMHAGISGEVLLERNLRNVWSISPKGFREAHFACVDAETEALTTQGWKKHHELQDGEPIAAYERSIDALVWQPATFYRYPYDGPLIAIEKRDSSQRMTPDHRCLVRRRVSGVGETTAARLKPGMSILTAATLWRPAEDGGPGEDFAALLGWYLTEGERRRHRAIRISQSQSANPLKVDAIRALLNRLGSEFRERTRTREWRCRPSVEVTFSVFGKTADALEAHSPDKRIDLSWMNWPKETVRALLDAIIDGDGHRRTDGRACVVQKDKAFLDAFQVLALRLGWRTQINARKGGGHILYITKGNWLTLRSTDGKHTPIGTRSYKGIVWCPAVASTFWIARRQGKTFITGNTFPPALVEPCIMAGCPPGGVVLDPFGGAGTVGLVALELGRRAVLIELKPEYAAMAARRIAAAHGARAVVCSRLPAVVREAAE
jgi:DNA modification methylase